MSLWECNEQKYKNETLMDTAWVIKTGKIVIILWSYDVFRKMPECVSMLHPIPTFDLQDVRVCCNI